MMTMLNSMSNLLLEIIIRDLVQLTTLNYTMRTSKVFVVTKLQRNGLMTFLMNGTPLISSIQIGLID